MSQFKKTAVAITLSSLLIGCGGSGGSSNNSGVTPSVNYDFTITAQVVNKCGTKQPLANVDFFLQNSEWGLISAHKTDANGQVSLTTTQSLINYTVAKEQVNGDVISQVELQSFIDVNSNGKAVVVFNNTELADNTTCECNTQDLDLSYSIINTLSSTSSSANFTNSELTSTSSSEFNDVEVCRTIGQDWPQESFTAVGINNKDELTGFSGFTNNFDATPDSDWALNTNALSITLDVDHEKYDLLTTAQLLNDKLHFIYEVDEDASEAVIFDSHSFTDDSTYYGRATNSHQELISFVGKVISKSEHTKLTSNYEDSIILTPSLTEADVDTILFSEIQESGEYDYSDVEGFPAIHFTTTVDTNKSNGSAQFPATWHVYGPITGLLPNSSSLTNYEYIESDISSIKNLKIEMFNSDISQNYSAYIAALTLGTTYQTAGVLSDYQTHYIELEK